MKLPGCVCAVFTVFACGVAAPLAAGEKSPHPAQVNGALLTAPAGAGFADFGRVSLIAAALSRELAESCPFARPDDQAALESCKARLYGNSELRRQLPEFVLWGRILDPNLTLKDTTLTQFGRDVFTAAYMPLFMFNGKYEVRFDEREKLFRIELTTAFRNRLAPGLFPYPFWHDEKKWSMYQAANRLTVWVGLEGRAGSERIKALQFSALGQNHAGMPPPIATPAFDSNTHARWMWTDAMGKTQPQVTLFDGLYSAANPHLGRLDRTYRALALALRDGECMTCHVPNNPDKMKRLVLMQTPAHAASEIGRIISAVRQDRMPLDDIDLEQPLPVGRRNDLLAKAEAFDAAIRDARKWEAEQLSKLASPGAPAKRGEK